MIEDSERILKKLEAVRSKLYTDTETTNIASNDVIRTIALSNEIASDIKEVLIILQTTMATEFTEAKMSNFRINLEIMDSAKDVINLQNDIINKLYVLEATKKPTSTAINKVTSFLKDYKSTVSTGILLLLIWTLTVINSEAMIQVINSIPGFGKRIL